MVVGRAFVGRLRVAHCQPACPKSVHRSSSYAVHATGPDIAPLPVLVRLLEENGLPEDMGQSSHVLLLDTFLHQAITGPVLPSGAFTSLFSLLASLPCSPLLGCGITHTHTHTHSLSLSLSLSRSLSCVPNADNVAQGGGSCRERSRHCSCEDSAARDGVKFLLPSWVLLVSKLGTWRVLEGKPC